MIALAAALLAQSPIISSHAAASPTPYARAIAAGYKALTYCEGIFAAGRTPARIDRDELAGIYPEYDAIVPSLPARVDRTRRLVSVGLPDLPPRVAEQMWTGECLLHPIGYWAPAPLAVTTRVVPGPPVLWPQGDKTGPIRTGRALTAVLARGFADGYGAGAKTVAVVVVRDGRIAGERYGWDFGRDTPNRTWSVAKSMVGTLIGIARRESGLTILGPRSTAAEYRIGGAIPEATTPPANLAAWRGDGDGRARISLDNLLRMASGLHSDTAGNRTDAIYFAGVPVTRETVGWLPEALPGTRFRYSNNDILLAMLSLRGDLGEERYRGYPARALFAPLGMAHTAAGQDAEGNYILSSQVWSTARDLARLGQFWLQDGVWQGKRRLPEGWMRYMTTPSGPQPDAGKDGSGPGYGATMWLFGPKQGLPAGTYAAQGNRGQYIMVVPSERLVVVRRGEDPGDARFDIARFTADVIAAVR